MLPVIMRQGHRSLADQSMALYFELLKRALTNWLYRDMENTHLGRELRDERMPWRRDFGAFWREPMHTMVDFKCLDNVQLCVESVLTEGVPGDVIETGVWRGGVPILMRAILAAYGVTDRRVWVADSFQGLPPPDVEIYPIDKGLNLHGVVELAVSLEQVKSHFDRYGLLDDQVRFLKGWFRDSLPMAPIGSLAVIRLDGDLYESTMDALVHLYPKLSVGGYLIVDDYGAILQCRKAVHDYRAAHGITDKILPIDWAAVYWRRTM
jgi:hypothetical protein